MEVRNLENSDALSPGASLWILPDGSASRWTKRIDWYVNFQIFRARRRKPLKTEESVAKVVKDFEVLDVRVDPALKINEHSPLLISALNHLPAEALMILPWTKKLDTWVAQVVKTTEMLGLSPIRLFLPDSVDAETRKEIRKQLGSSNHRYELVEEKEWI